MHESERLTCRTPNMLTLGAFRTSFSCVATHAPFGEDTPRHAISSVSSSACAVACVVALTR